MKETIGDRLKKLRGDRTQLEFAIPLNSSKQNISKYEKNEMIPGGDFLQRLAEKEKININYLLTGEGNIYFSNLDYDSLHLEISRLNLIIKNYEQRLEKIKEASAFKKAELSEQIVKPIGKKSDTYP